MEIVLIKDWMRDRGTIKKGKELEVTNDLGRWLIKQRIAKKKRNGLISLTKAAFKKSDVEPKTKQEHRKTKKKEDK